MRREVAGPEHTGDHALCVTVCNVEVNLGCGVSRINEREKGDW